MQEITRIDPPAIIQRNTTEGEHILARLEQIARQQQMSTFDIAELLYEVKRNDLWALKKFESLEEFCKASSLDLKIREVHYLIAVHAKSKLLEISKDDLVKAKISKLKVIFQLDPAVQVEDPATGDTESMADIIRRLVKEAPFKTLVEIKEIVRRLMNDLAETPADELTWLNLPCRRDAKEVVTRALDMARALSGSTVDMHTHSPKDLSDAIALERICADFLADPNNQAEEFGEEGSFEDDFVTTELV